jgi:hypothetical protein
VEGGRARRGDFYAGREVVVIMCPSCNTSYGFLRVNDKSRGAGQWYWKVKGNLAGKLQVSNSRRAERPELDEPTTECTFCGRHHRACYPASRRLHVFIDCSCFSSPWRVRHFNRHEQCSPNGAPAAIVRLLHLRTHIAAMERGNACFRTEILLPESKFKDITYVFYTFKNTDTKTSKPRGPITRVFLHCSHSSLSQRSARTTRVSRPTETRSANWTSTKGSGRSENHQAHLRAGRPHTSRKRDPANTPPSPHIRFARRLWRGQSRSKIHQDPAKCRLERSTMAARRVSC